MGLNNSLLWLFEFRGRGDHGCGLDQGWVLLSKDRFLRGEHSLSHGASLGLLRGLWCLLPVYCSQGKGRRWDYRFSVIWSFRTSLHRIWSSSANVTKDVAHTTHYTADYRSRLANLTQSLVVLRLGLSEGSWILTCPYCYWGLLGCGRMSWWRLEVELGHRFSN